jgi:hypothetical protein
LCFKRASRMARLALVLLLVGQAFAFSVPPNLQSDFRHLAQVDANRHVVSFSTTVLVSRTGAVLNGLGIRGGIPAALRGGGGPPKVCIHLAQSAHTVAFNLFRAETCAEK